MYISYVSAKKEDFSASRTVMYSTNSKANKAICKAQQQARFSLSQLPQNWQTKICASNANNSISFVKCWH